MFLGRTPHRVQQKSLCRNWFDRSLHLQVMLEILSIEIKRDPKIAHATVSSAYSRPRASAKVREAVRFPTALTTSISMAAI